VVGRSVRRKKKDTREIQVRCVELSKVKGKKEQRNVSLEVEWRRTPGIVMYVTGEKERKRWVFMTQTREEKKQLRVLLGWLSAVGTDEGVVEQTRVERADKRQDEVGDKTVVID